MADETRTPEAVAQEARIIARKPYMREEDVDKELAALIREERLRAFMAGMRAEAQRSLTQDLYGRVAAEEVYKTARRLAVEGRSDG